MDPRAQSHPWQEMRRLQQQMEHLFSGLSPSLRSPMAGDYPPVNFTRKDDGITAEALCPGIDRDSIDVTVVGDVLTIRGQRKNELEGMEGRYHRRERPGGAFARAIPLDEPLNPDRADATYTNGILRVQVARAPEATPKKIAIKS